jgi:signal transduction histidine kinase
MGSRGRSIRLRIYFLVAIPLITMLGLFGYVSYTSVTSWLNQDRAPSLIQATSEPLTNFVNLLQAERRAAVVYLSHPDTASLGAYQSAIAVTKNGAIKLATAVNSPGTKNSTTPAETAAINKMTAQINGMTPLRASVTAKAVSPLGALAAYTNVIAGQGAVLQAEANSITDSAPVIQGLGLISAVNTQEDVSEQDAVLASALVSGSLTGPDRVAFSQAVGRQQDDTLTYQQLFTPAELKTYTTTLNALAPQALQNSLAAIQQAVPAGLSLTALEQQGLTPDTWQSVTKTWLHASSTAGTTTASTVLNANQQIAIDAKRRVWITAGVGAAGLILTLFVTILLGRSINRRLTGLRRAALTLAEEQLPAVVSRLRRGDTVDVAAEAPPLRAGNDEIGQVGQAIDTVRQTAIRAAVEESRLRQGVNDMFRNLARRSQSLLQRQLSVLDAMERKATDPDVLEDLFKMDHLTTRMRRHAEGLIILSGAPPGRGWSAPVKLVDVMRGAISEVEDYARVTVSTQSRAALSGSAVTDVIHLLAELIENATTLSPPFTQVRVSGETVANGFAIEIEDRGLGMTPQRMAELNERLAKPPEINPTNTEQLGLFVVGQLARRHGISVTLRQSPFGGTAAVALIPQQLIVEDGPAAITAGGPEAAAAANGAYAPNGSYPVNGSYPANGGYAGNEHYVANGAYAPYAPSSSYAPNGVYAANGSYGPEGSYAYGSYGSNGTGPRGAMPGNGNGSYRPPYGANGSGMPRPSFSPSRSAALPPDVENVPSGQDGYGGHGGYPDPAGSQRQESWRDRGGWPGTGSSQGPGPGGSNIRIPGAMRQAGGNAGAGSGPSADFPGARRGRHGASEVPVVTDVPVNRRGAPPADSFDVFTPLNRDEQGGVEQGSYAGTPATPPSYGQQPYGQQPYEQRSYEQPSYGDGNNGGDGGGYQQEDLPTGGAEHKGLPRRVRQANLAPQLRSSVGAAGSPGAAGVPQASAASLSDMRNTLSAMQRGWQQGRSQAQSETEGSGDGE